GIRDFHVTGVQTCALPIYQPDLGVRAHRGEGFARPFSAAALCCIAFHADRVRPVSVPEDTSRTDEGSHHHRALCWTGRLRFLLRSEERRVGKECIALWWR